MLVELFLGVFSYSSHMIGLFGLKRLCLIIVMEARYKNKIEKFLSCKADCGFVSYRFFFKVIGFFSNFWKFICTVIIPLMTVDCDKSCLETVGHLFFWENDSAKILSSQVSISKKK